MATEAHTHRVPGVPEALAIRQASDDPTASQTKRDRFKRRFHSRWRTARGEVRSLIQSDPYYQPGSRRPWETPAAQIGDFREELERIIDEEVVEPHPRRGVRAGRHYTGQFVDDVYAHGIELANEALEEGGFVAETPDATRALIRIDEHQFYREEYRQEAYDDLQDAARVVVQEGSREYRDSVLTGAAIGTTIKAVNGRLDKTGRHRSDLIAEAKSVEAINRAALTQYKTAGVEQVGIAPEAIPDGGVVWDEPGYEDRTPTPDARPEEWDFATAEDERVCDLCALFSYGGPYLIEDIESGAAPMPARDTHPGCRCVLLPAV